MASAMLLCTFWVNMINVPYLPKHGSLYLRNTCYCRYVGSFVAYIANTLHPQVPSAHCDCHRAKGLEREKAELILTYKRSLTQSNSLLTSL